MSKRPGTSVVLVLGAFVLLIAIVVGNSMGNRVLGQIASHGGGGVATPIAVASTAPPDTAASRQLWKRRQVLSVATDPAFPDPRITPEPEIPATPRPRRRETPSPTSKPSPRASAQPSDEATTETTPNTTYTSPPLPMPIASHDVQETIAPDATQSLAPRPPPRGAPTPGRGYPTLPPVVQPSFSPG